MSGLFGGRSSGIGGGLSGGVKLAAVGLLIHQLMKHARSQMPAEAGATPAPQTPSQGGGFGGLLDSLLGRGGASQGGLGGLVGGLAGMLGGLRGSGLGEQVDSWVSQGPNRSVPTDAVARAFDERELDAIAARAGTDRNALLVAISEVLPRLVDRMTPQGRLPEGEEELGGRSLAELAHEVADDQPRPADPARGRA